MSQLPFQIGEQAPSPPAKQEHVAHRAAVTQLAESPILPIVASNHKTAETNALSNALHTKAGLSTDPCNTRIQAAAVVPAANDNTTTATERNQPCDNLLAQVTKLFDEATVAQLDDNCLSPLIQDSVKQLKLTYQNKVICVPCGASQKFCAIVMPINNQEMAEQIKTFLDLNPRLSKTFVTIWENLAVIWIRINYGWLPVDRPLPGALWITSGLVPVAAMVEPPTTPYGFLLRGERVATIQFSEIQWQAEVHEMFLLEHIESQHGKLILQTGPRKRVFNLQTAARFLAAAAGITYDRTTDQFYVCLPPERKPVPRPKGELIGFVSNFFRLKAAKSTGQFLIANNQVGAVISLLKQICEVVRPGEREILLAYTNRRLERRPGANLTCAEIFADYYEDCKTLGVTAFPECVFRDVLPKIIREQHGLTKTHNVRRINATRGEHTCRNGFNGLGFKDRSAKDTTDGIDGQDDADGGAQKTGANGTKFMSQMSAQ